MAIFELTDDKIDEIKVSSFSELNITERGDLQRLLRDNIQTIADDLLVISEELRSRVQGPMAPAFAVWF